MVGLADLTSVTHIYSGIQGWSACGRIVSKNLTSLLDQEKPSHSAIPHEKALQRDLGVQHIPNLCVMKQTVQL